MVWLTMELQLVILNKSFTGVKLQPVINQMFAIESCLFVFPSFCLCNLTKTLFQQMKGSFQEVDWKSLHQSILQESSYWKSSQQSRGDWQNTPMTQSCECILCVMEIVHRNCGVQFCPAAAWIEPSICRKERAHKLLIKYMLIWSCESRKGWQYLPVCTRCYVQHQAHILLNCAASTCLLAAIGWRYRYSKYCWTMSLIAMAPAGRLQPTRPRDHHYT